jgi:transposase
MANSKFKTKVRYTAQFRQQIIDLVRAGRPIPELVQQYGCTATTIHNWLRQEKKRERPGEGALTVDEREELERLRRENRQLLIEREILSKAAAWFAQETLPSSKRSSDS